MDGIEAMLALHGGRAVRARGRAAAAARGDAGITGDRRHVGRDVHATLPLDDLGYRSGDFPGPQAYARAKRAQVALDARVVAQDPRACRVRGDAPGLGRHAGPRRVAARLLPPDAPAAALTGAGDRHDPVARDPSGPVRGSMGACSSTGVRVRSTVFRPPASRRPTGAGSGICRRTWRYRGSRAGARPAAAPADDLGDGGRRLDDAVGDAHRRRHRARLGRPAGRAADRDQGTPPATSSRDHEAAAARSSAVTTPIIAARAAFGRPRPAIPRRSRPIRGHDADAAPAQGPRRRPARRAHGATWAGSRPPSATRPGTPAAWNNAASRRSTAWPRRAAAHAELAGRPRIAEAAVAGSRTRRRWTRTIWMRTSRRGRPRCRRPDRPRRRPRIAGPADRDGRRSWAPGAAPPDTRRQRDRGRVDLARDDRPRGLGGRPPRADQRPHRDQHRDRASS